MLRRDWSGLEGWPEFVDEVDKKLDEALGQYSQDYPISDAELARALNELALLRSGGSINYETRGLAFTYSLVYTPRKAALLAVTLSHVLRDGGQGIRSVLDIGSGTGAGSLAIDLTLDGGGNIICVEPSQEMQGASNYLAPTPGLLSQESRFERSPVAGDLDDVINGVVPIPRLSQDLVIMSSCLQPDMASLGQEWWNGFSVAMRSATVPGSILISVEPHTKKNLGNRLSRALTSTGWSIALDSECRTLAVSPDTRKRPLHRLSQRLSSRYHGVIYNDMLSDSGRDLVVERSSAGGPSPAFYPVVSWNDHRDYWERILVFRR